MTTRSQMRTFVCATPECGRTVYTYRPERVVRAHRKCSRCHKAIHVNAKRKCREKKRRIAARKGKKIAARKLAAFNRAQSMAARMEAWNQRIKQGWKQ